MHLMMGRGGARQGGKVDIHWGCSMYSSTSNTWYCNQCVFSTKPGIWGLQSNYFLLSHLVFFMVFQWFLNHVVTLLFMTLKGDPPDFSVCRNILNTGCVSELSILFKKLFFHLVVSSISFFFTILAAATRFSSLKHCASERAWTTVSRLGFPRSSWRLMTMTCSKGSLGQVEEIKVEAKISKKSGSFCWAFWNITCFFFCRFTHVLEKTQKHICWPSERSSGPLCLKGSEKPQNPKTSQNNKRPKWSQHGLKSLPRIAVERPWKLVNLNFFLWNSVQKVRFGRTRLHRLRLHGWLRSS